MAKKSKVVKNLQRIELSKRYSKRRADLLNKIKDENLSYEEKQELRLKLEKLPKNSNKIRIRNRCSLTGRPRGVYRKFGLSRITFREMALQGLIPGVTKASW
tara:strand:+ start:382 stop:687 length:306 start_codon:yes stop_codon:yes gene_type:complete